MAVQPTTNRTVPLYVLIIFIVLFLGSVTGLVILFLYHEQLRQERETAVKQFDDYVGSQNKVRLEAYKAAGGETGAKAVGALLAERDELARLLAGSPEATPQQVREKLELALAQLPPEAAELKSQAQVDLVGAVGKAAVALQAMAGEKNALRQQVNECQKGNTTVTQKYQELEQKIAAESKKTDDRLAALTKEVEDYKKEYSSQLDSLEKKIGADLKTRLDAMSKSFRQDVKDMQDLVRRNLQSLIRSMKELGPAEERITSTLTLEKLLQRSDGQVLDTSGGVIYISLGSKQAVKVGARFFVYSKLEAGATSPKLKADIEVTAVGDLTSEARVVLARPDNPVIPGDLINNIVFDPNLKLTFFVLGEFDFNGDGISDPTGPQRVMEIISACGGTVAQQLSPTVNFVIMGTEPPKPAEPTAAASAEVQAGYKKQMAAVRNYNDLKSQIQALAVPVISLQEFLKYTGFSAALD